MLGVSFNGLTPDDLTDAQRFALPSSAIRTR